MRKWIVLFGFVGLVLLTHGSSVPTPEQKNKTEYFDITGKSIKDTVNLPNGIYLRAENGKTTKIIINN